MNKKSVFPFKLTFMPFFIVLSEINRNAHKNLLFTIPILILFFSSCSEETLPKPKAYLRLSYDKTNYHEIDSNCPYTFEMANEGKAVFNEECWVNVTYPKLSASLNITYRTVENNLSELLQESEKLTYKHVIKADDISSQPYHNFENKKYGKLLEVTGNAASPLQFYLTDSTRHFITGALYFNVQPNYDSILPAIKHIENDVKHLMETLEWKHE